MLGDSKPITDNFNFCSTCTEVIFIPDELAGISLSDNLSGSSCCHFRPTWTEVILHLQVKSTSSQIETKYFDIIFTLRHPVITSHCLIDDMIKYKRTFSHEDFPVVAFWQKLIQDIDNLTLHSFLWLRIILPSNNKQLIAFFSKRIVQFFGCQLYTLFFIGRRCSFLRRSNNSNSVSDNSSLI